MPIEIINTPESASKPINRMRSLVPLRITHIQSLVEGGENSSRWHDVNANVSVGDVCVRFDDQQLHAWKILNCRLGTILTSYYADYLLFEYATDIARVVIAKPEN